MFLTRKNLPRRTLLRGAGVTLALPFLDAMVPAAGAQAADKAAVPRLGYFYVPNGEHMPYWTPKKAGASFPLTPPSTVPAHATGGIQRVAGADLELSPTLMPLAPYRDQVTVISGLSNYESTKAPGGGVHTRANAAWMTGALAKPTEAADVELSTSADQYAARVLGRETMLESLELSTDRGSSVGNCEYNYSCLYESTISWRNATTPNPCESNPRAVFERLFGEEADAETRMRRLLRRKSVLDNIRQELTGLRKTLGSSDREAIEQYLEYVRNVERRIQKVEQQGVADVSIAAPLGVPKTYDEHVKLLLDLLVLAYQADITRVATFILAREGGGHYPWIGVTEMHHELSHHQNDPRKHEQLVKINAYHMGLFAGFVDKLKNTRDGDGTLLDRAFMLYGGGMSDGDLHSPLDLPLVLVGGGSGKLKGNQHVGYPLDRKTPMTNLHVTMLHKVGVPVDRMVDSTGELTEL
jgi:hypothetical protein